MEPGIIISMGSPDCFFTRGQFYDAVYWQFFAYSKAGVV